MKTKNNIFKTICIVLSIYFICSTFHSSNMSYPPSYPSGYPSGPPHSGGYPPSASSGGIGFESLMNPGSQPSGYGQVYTVFNLQFTVYDSIIIFWWYRHFIVNCEDIKDPYFIPSKNQLWHLSLPPPPPPPPSECPKQIHC